jgi:MFS family permease
MAPFATFLISRVNWKPAYRIIGFIAWAIVLPLSQLLKKEPGEIGALPDGVRDNPDERGTGVNGNNETGASLSLAEAVRTRGFWLVVAVWLFFSFCMSLLFTHIAPHLTDIGISEANAAVVISVMGIARVIGMIGLGVVADRIGRKRVAVISAVIQSGAMLWLVWAGELWMFYLFAILYGLGNGGLFTGVTSLLGDTFGLKRLGSILGLLEIGWGIGAAAGPLTGGLIFDSTQSYSWAFALCTGAMLAIAVLVVMLNPEAGRTDRLKITP